MEKYQKILLSFQLPRGKMTRRYYTDKTRRFTANSVPNLFLKAKIYIDYGKKECNYGCVCRFTNEGIATNKKELVKLVRYFLS